MNLSKEDERVDAFNSHKTMANKIFSYKQWRKKKIRRKTTKNSRRRNRT